MSTTYSFEDFEARYQQLTAAVFCDCELATEMVGGQPGGEAGIRAFATHHLKLTDPTEIEQAVKRILAEEIGERDITPVEGELQEKRVYGVNVIRRTDFGPFLGNWMVKACLKQAASRLKIFQDYKGEGAKGNFSESGRVYAAGVSLLEQDHPDRIYLIGPDGTTPAKTYFQEFMGRVSGPKGSKSIVHHSECAAPGTRFAFEYRLMPGTLKDEDLRDVLALAMIMGLGSVKALERGKFRILTCTIGEPQSKRAPKNKKNEEAIPVTV